MNDKDRVIIEKIKKLLALSQSNNEYEAAAAAEKARELLEAYRLSMSDVERTSDVITDKYHNLDRPNFPQWLCVLIEAISKHFNCKAIYYRRDYDNPTVRVRFVGTEIDIEITEYVFTYLYRTVQSIASDQKVPPGHNAIQFKNSFRYGLSMGIKEKLEQMRSIHEHQMPKDLKAKSGEMVVIKTARVDAYIVRNMPKLGKRRPSSLSLTDSAYDLGVEKGRQVSINSAVKHFSSVKAIER